MNIEELIPFAKIMKPLFDVQGTNSFFISNLEHFLYVSDGLGLGLKEGDMIKEGSSTYHVITSKQSVRETFTQEESLFNVEYTSMGIPFFNEQGDICGAIMWAISTNGYKLSQMAQGLLALSEEIAATSEEFAKNAAQLSDENQGVLERSETLVNEMNQIEEVNSLVTELATESHFLGINAAIEAARAGEYGSGFSVVAEEIRRLSRESKSSAKTISANISRIVKNVEDIFTYTRNVTQIGDEQAASAQELATAIQQITEVASVLNDIANAENKTD